MRVPGEARIGISGWRYKGWRGVFYPKKLAQREELHHASRQFNTIELNGSFYSLQRPESFAAWAELEQPCERYLLASFCYGCNLGPSQTARSVQGTDRRQIAWINQRHISEDALDDAITSVINAYNNFTLPRLWGSGKHASADGTRWDLYEQNLLSEYGSFATFRRRQINACPARMFRLPNRRDGR